MVKFKNKKCEACGFDLSSAEVGLYDEIHTGEYLGHCPSCLGQAQPVVEGEPKKAEPKPSG